MAFTSWSLNRRKQQPLHLRLRQLMEEHVRERWLEHELQQLNEDSLLHEQLRVLAEAAWCGS